MAISRDCCKKLARKLSRKTLLWQGRCKCGAIIKKGKTRSDIAFPTDEGCEIEEEIIDNYHMAVWKESRP